LPTKFSATLVAKDFFHGCAEDNPSQSPSMEDEFGLKNIEISTAEVSYGRQCICALGIEGRGLDPQWYFGEAILALVYEKAWHQLVHLQGP